MIIMRSQIIIFVGYILMNFAMCKIHLEKEHDLKFEWEIIAKFMEDQYVVTLFVERNYNDYGHLILKHSIKKFLFGTFYYNSDRLISQYYKSFERISMYTERIYGAIIVTRNLNITELLVKVSANNKIVLVLFDIEINVIKKMLKMFWDKYRTFTMITLSISSNNTNRIILQNPFRSQFFEYPIDKIMSSKNFTRHLNEQYQRFISNMNKHPLKVYIFEFPFFSMPIMNKAGQVIGYSGMHGTMLKITKQLMNFTPIFVRETTGLGSMFGLSSARAIEDGRAEIGLNGRFILGGSLNNTVYLYPTDKVPFKFVVPINYEQKPLEIFTYYFFDIPSRICIALTLVVTTSIWLYGIRFFKFNAETATSAIPLKVLALIHSVSVKIPKKLFSQIIFVTIAFFGLLLGSVYQGKIVELLSIPFKPLQLETLKDLLQSNLNIAVITYDSRSNDTSSVGDINLLVMGDIGRKTVQQYNEIKEAMDIVAYNKTMAVLMPYMFFNTYAVKYFNKTTGLDLLHSIKEPPTTTFVSYAIARNSPYIGTFNRITRLCIESGITRYDINKAAYNQQLFYMRRIKSGYVPKEQKSVRPITLSDVVLVKYFFVISITISAIVFLLELVVNFLVKRCSRLIPLQ